MKLKPLVSKALKSVKATAAKRMSRSVESEIEAAADLARSSLYDIPAPLVAPANEIISAIKANSKLFADASTAETVEALSEAWDAVNEGNYSRFDTISISDLLADEEAEVAQGILSEDRKRKRRSGLVDIALNVGTRAFLKAIPFVIAAV